jgi:hypothetical protein
MADDLRPEVVAALSEPAHLPATLVDEILDATPAEREAAAVALLDSMGSTRAALEQPGALRPTISVLDLDHDRLQALASVYALTWRWSGTPGYRQRPLSTMLKVIPVDVAEAAMRLLRAYGFAPPEPAEEQ